MLRTRSRMCGRQAEEGRRQQDLEPLASTTGWSGLPLGEGAQQPHPRQEAT